MNLVDRLICEIDTGLRTIFGAVRSRRAIPGGASTQSDRTRLAGREREESIRLMRVNHCGEVCAQALYQGQALFSKDTATRDLLMHAADEERDHLAWCAARLSDLGGSSSRLSPIFYAGSFGFGLASGLLGDKWSMGFLVETERQVEAHLQNHLERVPEADRESRAVLEAMRQDEIRHGQSGLAQGAAILPPPVRTAMQAFSKVMTGTTYWV